MTEVQEEEELQEARKDCPLEFLGGAQPCQRLDCGLLASRTADLSPQFMVICYSSHRKLVPPESRSLTEGPCCGLGGDDGATPKEPSAQVLPGVHPPSCPPHSESCGAKAASGSAKAVKEFSLNIDNMFASITDFSIDLFYNL